MSIESFKPPGLVNLGNMCYMNSIIQCLAYTEPLTNYFLAGTFRDHINDTNPMYRGLAEEWFKVLCGIFCQGKSLYKPLEFKTCIKDKSHFEQLQGYGQQDSSEFLVKLLDGLHENLNKIKGVKPHKNFDIKNNKESIEEYIQYMKTREDSIIKDLFNGFFKSELVCVPCKNISIAIDPYTIISLEVKNEEKNFETLDECLRFYKNPATLKENERYTCSECKVKVEAIKIMSIYNTPDILTIHLKRFEKEPGKQGTKINTSITFPLELDMREHVSNPKENELYELYATSNHMGGTEGGHYIAHIKNNGTWYYMNDESEATELKGDFKNTDPTAYVLFYKRKVPAPSQQKYYKDFKALYLKYKAKYLALKNKL